LRAQAEAELANRNDLQETLEAAGVIFVEEDAEDRA